MKKLLALVSVAGLLGMMSGCGLMDPTEANITTTINTIGTVTINSGAVSFTVEVKSDSAITSMTYKVTQGGVDKTANFNITPPNVNDYKDKKNVTMNFSIAAKSSATAGDYDFTVTVTAGDISDDDTRSFKVEGTSGTPVTTATVTIGSYDNPSVGSSIDLDNGSVKLAAAATQANSGVDIVGTYSSRFNAFRIFNPVYARDSSNITAFANWQSPNNTKFHKVSVSFSSITTKEQIQALFDESKATANALSCAANDVLVVKTDQGAYVLVELTSFDASATGTANIKYGK